MTGVRDDIEANSIWITGLSASGKSTLANLLVEKLRSNGHPCILLDGDEVRTAFRETLGYDPDSRHAQARRVLDLARLIAKQGILTVVPVINAFAADREMCRRELAHYFEIYLKCDLEVCVKRDIKNLYLPAYNGQIDNVVGVDIAYEAPENPELTLESDCLTPEQMNTEAWNTIIKRLKK